jgi:hypothetical protein
VRKPTATLPPDHPEVVAERLAELERKMDRLRALYESFFSGAERRPPNTPRREMNRLMLETQQLSIRNVGLRFRFQTLSQRWTLYTTYWNRTLREIEAGTYRRDLAKASRRLARRGEPLTESEVVALGIPLTRAKAFVERQNRYLIPRTDFDSERTVADGTPLPPAPLPRAPPPEVPGLSDEDIAVLHKKYNDALSSLAGEGDQSEPKRPPISAAKLKAMLVARVPAILQQQGATRVAFDVATRDGRVVLKAKPIK